MLKPFDELDWKTFSGCESDNPLIGHDDAEQLVVVVDGNCVNVNHNGGIGYFANIPDGIPVYAKECADHAEAVATAERLLAIANKHAGKIDMARELRLVCGDPIAFV